MVDLIRLILIILFLPLIIIFVGPLLLLSVFKGQQQVGPITLDSTRYDVAGKAGIFMLGVAIWVCVWGGLAWLLFTAILLPSTVEQVSLITPSPVVTVSLTALDITDDVNTDDSTATMIAIAEPSATAMMTPTPTPTPTLTPSPVPATLPPTFTPLPPTATYTPAPLPTPSPTLGPIIPVGGVVTTPSVVTTSGVITTPEATLTPTSLFNEVLATNTTTPAPLPTLTGTVSITATKPRLDIVLTPGERQAAIDMLDEANLLLQEAISSPSKENLENLGQVWQGQSLTDISEFALELYERYDQPFEAQFEYMTPPRIVDQSSSGEIVVTSQERWFYGGPTSNDQEAFAFTYTFSQVDGVWAIIQYDYLNLPLPTPTTISVATVELEDIHR